MKVRYSIFLVLICLSTSVFSQTYKDSLIIRKTVPRFHLLPFGLSLEQHLVNHSTIVFDIGIGASIKKSENSFTTETEFLLSPYLYASLEPRIYLNLESRSNKGKQTHFYSGSYGSLLLLGAIDPSNLNDWFALCGPIFGFQRSYESKVYWSAGIGAGAKINNEDISLVPIGRFSFGVILSEF